MTKEINNKLVVEYAVAWMKGIVEEFDFMNYHGKFGIAYDWEEAPIEYTDIHNLLWDYMRDLVNSRIIVDYDGYFKDATIVAIDEDGDVADTKEFENISLGIQVNEQTKDVARKLNDVLFDDDEYDNLNELFNDLLPDQQFFIIWQNAFNNNWLDEFKEELYKL